MHYYTLELCALIIIVEDPIYYLRFKCSADSYVELFVHLIDVSLGYFGN